MAGSLIRYDLSLPCYFSNAPAPGVAALPQLRRAQPQGLYMRGEIGEKRDGSPRPITAHNTTHLDAPFHFYEEGQDIAALLNRRSLPAADGPVLARVVLLGGRPGSPGAHVRDGVTYCEAVDKALLPSTAELRGYEALVVLTGFGELMAAPRSGQFQPDTDGYFHIPYLTADAVEHIVAAGVSLLGIDSMTIEPQLSAEPHRMGSDAHFRLLGRKPPVLILEGLNGASLQANVGFAPAEVLLHVIPRRVNAAGADGAHSRVFAYFYREDAGGARLRRLRDAMSPDELYG